MHDAAAAHKSRFRMAYLNDPSEWNPGPWIDLQANEVRLLLGVIAYNLGDLLR